MSKKKPAAKAKQPKFKNLMEGIGHYAQIEWEEFSDGAEPAAFEPRIAFITGYLFGTGLGMALALRKPELAVEFSDRYRARGWDV